jgi:hypothetical protein
LTFFNEHSTVAVVQQFISMKKILFPAMLAILPGPGVMAANQLTVKSVFPPDNGFFQELQSAPNKPASGVS